MCEVLTQSGEPVEAGLATMCSNVVSSQTAEVRGRATLHAGASAAAALHLAHHATMVWRDRSHRKSHSARAQMAWMHAWLTSRGHADNQTACVSNVNPQLKARGSNCLAAVSPGAVGSHRRQ